MDPTERSFERRQAVRHGREPRRLPRRLQGVCGSVGCTRLYGCSIEPGIRFYLRKQPARSEGLEPPTF